MYACVCVQRTSIIALPLFAHRIFFYVFFCAASGDVEDSIDIIVHSTKGIQ